MVENGVWAGLKEYISQENELVGLNNVQLIITIKKSYRGPSIDTMQKWV